MAAALDPVPHRLARPRLPLVPRRPRRSSGSAPRSTSSRSTTTCCRRRTKRDRERGVGGETWEIHGGGFYRIEKFQVAPHDASGAAALVQVGGLLDVDLGLRALRRPLLPPGAHDADRPGGRRPVDAPRRSARASACSRSAWLVYDVLCRTVGQRSEARARACILGLVAVTAYGVDAAVRAARRVPAGGRDARDDHGRERLLRDHPGAPGARAREGGGPRARPGRERARQAALDAQQLPDAAGAVRDARGPLPVHVRPRAQPGRSSSA